MPGIKWTEEEIQYIKDNYFEKTCEEMAIELPNRTVRAIQHLFLRIGQENGWSKTLQKYPSIKIGDKFGRLEIIGEQYQKCDEKGRSQGFIKVKCGCDAKTEKDVRVNCLRMGTTVSCGCWKNEQAAERAATLSKTHGLTRHPIYSTYNAMKARCKYESQPEYKHYGGRGIKVCEEWENDFLAFYNWAINNGWQEGLTIERKEVNGNYEPSNCCWIPKADQAKNKTNSVIYKRFIEAFGENKLVADWQEDPRCKVDGQTLLYRIDNGWDLYEAFSTPSERDCLPKHERIKIGDKFGSWEIIDYPQPDLVNNKGRQFQIWKVKCRCQCGTERMVRVDNLMNGKTSSCSKNCFYDGSK